MTFIVLMIFCGILLNEIVIQPFKRADAQLKQFMSEIEETRNNE